MILAHKKETAFMGLYLFEQTVLKKLMGILNRISKQSLLGMVFFLSWIISISG